MLENLKITDMITAAERSKLWLLLQKIYFTTHSGQILMIEVNQVFSVVLNIYEPKEMDDVGVPTKFQPIILIMYINGAVDKLPATPENTAMALQLLKELNTKTGLKR
ncbi:hypothetical protein QN397_07530 [Variovorax sp. RTB1]|uniref:hypothetical protein n=1 Tax=Variovorax sp. RTB1 TaxID=3048631 RepID=UPI002B22EEFB|nr:hypothetical protein [Variovorax sp. RTB1]MEB0111201.1 hypothetical protein [Variovorax sp. RTB1]